MSKKIVFVVQRYGEQVIGGSESECRMYAERLAKFCEVEVITSCAIDHLTWKNELPEGVSTLNGVTVRRFPVLRERDVGEFLRLGDELTHKPGHSLDLDDDFLMKQGPYAPAAIDYLCAHADEYRCAIFMTYLYYPTVEGLRRFPGKKLVVPTAHDEWSIYFPCYRDVFEYADGYIYNSEAERRFVDRTFLETVGKPFITIGAGVEYPDCELPDAAERFGLTKPYLVYCGRVEAAKGCGEMLEAFLSYKRRFGGDLQLVLTGKLDMALPRHGDIVSLGFVSEAEKYAVMKNALALVLASRFESLSIVVLESLMMGRPVIVNGKCEVLRDHCIESGAGLFVSGTDEFCAALHWLRTHPEEYERMCRNGEKYVAERYSWNVILTKMRCLIDLVAPEE